MPVMPLPNQKCTHIMDRTKTGNFSFVIQITTFFAGKDRQGQRLSSPEYFLCGMFTGAVAALVEGPIDLVR